MIHRLICRLFGQHSLYRIAEEDYPDYAHMKCRYCGMDEWHREHGCVPLPAPWPKPPYHLVHRLRGLDEPEVKR